MTITRHTVKKGETLTEIAKKYNTTPQAIARLNGIRDENLIYPEQKLTIQQSDDRFLICIARVLKHEGGAVDHKADKGGRTNFGISQYIYKAMQRDGLTNTTDVYEISEQEAQNAYRKYFWDAYNIGKYPKGFDYYYLDLYINHSPAAVKKITAKTDGGLIAIKESRDDYYYHLVEQDPTQKVFLKGWLNRNEEVYKVAVSEL